MPDDKPKDDEKPGNLPEGVTKILEEMKVKLEGLESAKEPKAEPKAAAPTYQDRRAALQKSLGFNDEQMVAHERTILESQGPIIENLGWTRLEKRADLDTYRKEIEEELKAYGQEVRSPELMEKIYYYVKGKHADSKPPEKKEPAKPTGVERVRVSGGPGYTGAEPGLPAGGGDERSPEEELALDDREKFVAAKMGVSEKDYAKARNVGRAIRELRVPDERPATSLADLELRRMQGRR